MGISNSLKTESLIEKEDDSSATTPAMPDAGRMLATIETLREHERNYGATPNSELTKHRLLSKSQQSLSQRGAIEEMQNAATQSHPILADSPYFSGIDDAVNPLLEFMTEEEAARYEQELQYQQRKKLEKQMALTSSPSLTR